MFKILKKTAIPLFLSLSLTTMADENLDVDYFEDEGKLLFKVRAFGIIGDAQMKNMPNSTSQNPVPLSKFIKNGYGGDVATAIFVNDNIAAELSTGLQVYNVKSSHFAQIANNYNGNASNIGKKKQLYGIPVTATLQYHIAPFGAIRPYIGGGYHVSYFISKSKNIKPGKAHGPIGQVGIDFIAKDDTLITFDVKKTSMKSRVTYKGAQIGSNPGFRGKLKYDPLLVSVGVGFKL